ncbi:MAG TPA: 30S ribosomal protein S2 [Ktedonobacterales bacterium]|jgi:small subunit ribosomal protein S2|nr:30S ribosomal protein S2 [Ktedonobacterales bacterium]
MAQNATTMKQLLEAGVHFGHQTRRWNPKMRPFIFRAHNGIHILDLQQTVQRLNEATRFVTNLTANGEHILFVGTKKQAQESIRDEAERSGQFFVNHRWLGGMLTNFQTIQLRIRYMKDLEVRRENGEFDRLPKKEAQHLTDELERLNSTLGGIRNMRRLPAAVFVVDTRKEHTAVLEARRLEIPVIALADTNCDPDEMDYPIPSNDDAIRAVRLLCEKIADAALDGRRQYESQRERAEGATRATAAPITLEEFGPEPGAGSAEAAEPTNGAAPASAAPAEGPAEAPAAPTSAPAAASEEVPAPAARADNEPASEE